MVFPINAGHHTVNVKFWPFQCFFFPFQLFSFSFHLVFSVLYLDPADPLYLDEKEE